MKIEWKQIYDALEGAAYSSWLHQKFGYIATIEIILELTDKTYEMLEILEDSEVKQLKCEDLETLIKSDLSEYVYPDDDKFIEKYRKKVTEALQLLGYQIELGDFAKKRVCVTEFDEEGDRLAYSFSKGALEKRLGRPLRTEDEIRFHTQVARALYQSYKLAKNSLVGYDPEDPSYIKYRVPIIELQRKLNGELRTRIVKEVGDEFLTKISRANQKAIKGYSLYLPQLATKESDETPCPLTLQRLSLEQGKR